MMLIFYRRCAIIACVRMSAEHDIIHIMLCSVESQDQWTQFLFCERGYRMVVEDDAAKAEGWTPEMLALWHPEKNGVLKPADITPGSRKAIWWRCTGGHSWKASVYSVKAGTACPYCSGRNAIPGKTDLATVRHDMLEEWDFEKNAGIDPGTVSASSHERVWWKCSLGHSWQAMIFSRTRDLAAGCPYCTGKKVLPGFNDLATKKPKVAEEWYQLLNGELKPEEVSPGSNRKVWWRCREGHVWQAAIYSRTRERASSCPVCAGTVKQRETKVETTQRKARPCVRQQKRAPQVNV